jgi:hypothetical protein
LKALSGESTPAVSVVRESHVQQLQRRDKLFLKKMATELGFMKIFRSSSKVFGSQVLTAIQILRF